MCPPSSHLTGSEEGQHKFAFFPHLHLDPLRPHLRLPRACEAPDAFLSSGKHWGQVKEMQPVSKAGLPAFRKDKG